RGRVVPAGGGFAGSAERGAKPCRELKDLPYLGTAGAKGDAVRLATPLGAALRHPSACAVTPLLAQPSHLAVTRAVIDHGGILVDQRGRRFTGESQASLPLAARGSAAPGGGASMQISESIVDTCE